MKDASDDWEELRRKVLGLGERSAHKTHYPSLRRRLADLERLRAKLQQSETYLSKAQRLSHTGSFGWNAATGEMTWSHETFRIFEYDSALTPTLDLVFLHMHPEDRVRVRQILDQASKEGTDCEYEHRLLMPDNRLKWLLIRAHAVRNSSGNLEFLGAVTDVTDRHIAEVELKRQQSEICALNERLTKAQEEERARIAGELHDDVLQQITLISLALGSLKYEVPPDSEVNKKIDGLQKRLIELGTDIRQLSHELHPAVLQEGGLPDALSDYCEEFSRTRGIPVTCDTDATTKELSPVATVALYRIAQEALGNVAKHSKAKTVHVRLTHSKDRARLSVSDDGVGCTPDRPGESGGLGLVSMRERVRQLKGMFDFQSEPGHGTTVTAEVPFRPTS